MSIQLLSAVISTACAAGTQPLYDEEINNAISMIATELISRHNSQQCWEPINGSKGWLTKYYGGTTALTTLAMLSAGQSVNSPEISTSLEFLESIESPSTYVLATRTSVWATMPERFKKNLKKDTKQLVSRMGLRAGSWGNYEEPPASRSSASPLNREFGMIALREAERSGQHVPKKCWVALANATLLTQQDNGGWSYQQGTSNAKSTSNMTVAALNCLLGVDEMQGSDLSKDDADWLHKSIERAIAWLNKHSKTTKNVGGTTLMSYLYGLERAAMSCGLSEIRNRNWFKDGAKAIIKTHCGTRKAKGSTINLSFALLFLARGKVPVALCELAIDKGIVDPIRTSDKIASRVSNHTERALAWQIVTEDESVEIWLAAPFLLLQDTKAVPNNLSKLNKYLDSGGLLVMLGSKKDFKTFSSLANKLCPSIQSKDVDTSHWALSILNKVKSVKVTAWNDGIRDRILLINKSPKEIASSEKSKGSQVLVNISCGVAELSRWKPKLSKPIVAKSRKTLWVAEHDGHWDAEMIGFQLWNVKSKPIHEIKNKNIVFVGGLYEDEATSVLAKEIIRIASEGSTVLVESIGGQHDFAAALQHQIEKSTNNTFYIDEKLQHFKGQRGWSIHNRKEIELPTRATIDNGTILIVNCDIRNALLNQSAWGVHGYDPESAVQLVDTLLEE